MTQHPRILREDQARTVAAIQQALVDNDSVLATAPTGAGKCHPAGTLILLHDGSVKDVMHIKSGDRLMGPDSRPRTVLTTTPGYGPIVKITPSTGEPWRCNTHHVLTLVRTGDPNPSLHADDQRRVLTDISIGDYLKRSQRWRHIHQLIKSGPLQFEEPDSAHQRRTMPPYILGVLLGHHDLTHRTTPAEANNHEIFAQLERYTSNAALHRRPPTHRPTRVFSSSPNDTTDACLPAINRHCAGDQFIPQPYRTAPQADRLELLAGLIDTNARTDDIGLRVRVKIPTLRPRRHVCSTFARHDGPHITPGQRPRRVLARQHHRPSPHHTLPSSRAESAAPQPAKRPAAFRLHHHAGRPSEILRFHPRRRREIPARQLHRHAQHGHVLRHHPPGSPARPPLRRDRPPRRAAQAECERHPHTDRRGTGRRLARPPGMGLAHSSHHPRHTAVPHRVTARRRIYPASSRSTRPTMRLPRAGSTPSDS